MSSDEFDIIKRYFAPLAKDEAARGLLDDAAVLAAQGRVVVTTDTIVEGVHFLPDDPIQFVAKKALRVNLSDLAAKGAEPIGVLLALSWPDMKPTREIARFAEGLKEDLDFYKAPLIGGDTTSTSGPLTITITALGAPYGPRVPARADAVVGDDVWVTGVIGDAWLGLQARRGPLPPLDTNESATLARRYQVPEPPVSFAAAIARSANASMDVSDGLLTDAKKIASASKVRVRLEAAAAPLSDLAQRWLSGAGLARRVELLSGGDDYQILFTAPQRARAEILGSGEGLAIRVTRIGSVEAGEGVALMDEAGAEVAVLATGYRHKLGR
ncbi:MAG: thiamine-phosphate kinase [Terricaulis sp.]